MHPIANSAPPKISLSVVAVAVLATVALAVGLIVTWSPSEQDHTSMVVAFGNLDQQSSQRIQTHLALGQHSYRVANNGRDILVAAPYVDQIRQELAESGLGSGAAGYALFDQAQPFAASGFVNTITHIRALEGELMRTLTSIEGVKAARVHLTIPWRRAFARETQASSASVMLKLDSGQWLAPAKVQAIQVLIGAAVPGLQSADVAIIDGQGRLLTYGSAPGSGSAPGAENAEWERVAYEDRLREGIERLLVQLLGAGRAQIAVHVDRDTSAGSGKRVSVAVLVDGVYTAGDGQGGDAGSYQPRSSTELQTIRELVSAAIGANEQRGDTIHVVNMRFSPSAEAVLSAQDGSRDKTESAAPVDSGFAFGHSALLREIAAPLIYVGGALFMTLLLLPVLRGWFPAPALPAAPSHPHTGLSALADTEAGGGASWDDADGDAPLFRDVA